MMRLIFIVFFFSFHALMNVFAVSNLDSEEEEKQVKLTKKIDDSFSFESFVFTGGDLKKEALVSTYSCSFCSPLITAVCAMKADAAYLVLNWCYDVDMGKDLAHTSRFLEAYESFVSQKPYVIQKDDVSSIDIKAMRKDSVSGKFVVSHQDPKECFAYKMIDAAFDLAHTFPSKADESFWGNNIFHSSRDVFDSLLMGLKTCECVDRIHSLSLMVVKSLNPDRPFDLYE